MVQAYKLNKKLIIRDEYGQLGNILFRLGNALAFALEHGYRVEDYTLAFCNYHDGSSNIRFFEHQHPLYFFQFPRPTFPFIDRIQWKLRNQKLNKADVIENFDPTFDLQSLKPMRSYELKGFHFSSGNLVLEHRSKICETLRFRESEILPIKNLLNDARKKYEVLLGVHIRQKDYRTFYDGKYFVSADQYLSCIEKFMSLHTKSKSIGVVICSDEKFLIKDFQTKFPYYIYPAGSIAQDILALSLCDFILGPKATTMSAWAAYIGDTALLQVTKDEPLNSIDQFQKIKRLEPLNPFQSN